MPLETATHIKDLNISNPANSDGLNQADDHMRLIKSVLVTDIGDAMQSKKLTVPDGTSGAPAIGYLADATAGFYRKATGQQSVVGSLVGQGTVDIGFIGMFAAASVPTGYLACDGQAVSRTTYAALFTAIGTTWGAGDGSTTFNVPGFNSRFPRHREDAGRAGAVGTLQADVFKTHTHTVAGVTVGNNSVDHTHSFSGTTGSMNQNASHSHAVSGGTIGGTAVGAANAGANGLPLSPSSIVINSTNTDHQHTFSGTSAGASAPHTHVLGGNTDATGDATETRPLAASVLFCIRAL